MPDLSFEVSFEEEGEGERRVRNVDLAVKSSKLRSTSK
jgi:hypothetical protein